MGDAFTAQRLRPNAEIIDLENRLVVPGFVDGHAHVIGTGKALGQVSLGGAGTVDQIQQRVKARDIEQPESARILVFR
ncbi:amidohydrolase family protein [Arthrobacter sp. fls2-241-R2A-172]|uniref:amidohydrolase family protein n=1 Tax=Arthrobacter sp. fls2-241-R2A-172 TaxID=3040325 RepID=UPI00254FFA3B|nr:amidohydrolase family protein [Arthrobacter sp. fls2-241-R2A-172]